MSIGGLLPAQIIKLKRDGQVVPSQVIKEWIHAYAQDRVTDYQMAAFLMAVYWRGLSDIELKTFIEAMMDSGETLTWKNHPHFLVDKHSTGGVGDKTSLIVGPLVAAAGLSVPMMAGRGLGHTGGTIDKLEAIPGFRTNIDLKEFDRLVRNFNLGFTAQTLQICPADRKLYALRDVTATVDSIPLVCGSIMSKKLAEGIQGLVLDVKFGSGAFFKSIERAKELGLALKAVGERFGKKMVIMLSTMDQPLGRFAGNSLEVKECLEIMQGEVFRNAAGEDLYSDTRDLSIALSAQMMLLSDRWSTLNEATKAATEILSSGKAYKKFEEICREQGGDLSKLATPKFSQVVRAPSAGTIASFDVEGLGYLNVKLGAGRAEVVDKLDFAAGLEFHGKIGTHVSAGDPLFTLYASTEEQLKFASQDLARFVSISTDSVKKPDLIFSVIQ